MSQHDPITVEVQKSSIVSLLSDGAGGGGSGVDGEYLWPIPPRTLSTLYQASAEHNRAINVKSEGAFGGGLIGAAEPIEALCETGATELFTHLGLDLETFGNAFLQLIRATDDRIVGLRRLPAITMSRTKTGFAQRVATPGGVDRRITFAQREIIHLRELCPNGGHYSLPTWIGAVGMLELADAATKFNAAFFANNAVPEHAVIFKGPAPGKEQREAIKNFFRNEYRGVENAHRTLLLHVPEDGEVEIQKVTADIEDGDFLKLLDAARDRIPIAHGTPPRILGIVASGALGGGGEVAGQLFVFETLTLKPKRRRVLDQLRPLLQELGLRPGDPEAELAADQVVFRPLDLTPPSDDSTAVPALVEAGVISADEARALIPALSTLTQNDAEAPQAPVSRSAPLSQLEALTALLARS